MSYTKMNSFEKYSLPATTVNPKSPGGYRNSDTSFVFSVGLSVSGNSISCLKQSSDERKKMTWTRLFVTLKVPDNVARTALHTIQTRLGHPEVAALRRSDFWECRFAGCSATEAREHMEFLASRTPLFANPTKHRWIVETGEHPLHQTESPASPFEGSLSILVHDREDGTAEATWQALPRFLPEERIPADLQRGTWWDITLDPTAHGDMQDLAKELAVTRSRTRGLFCNPHYQDHRILIRHA